MLRYEDELRGTSGFELPAAGLKEARVTSKEIALAKRLIDDMTEKWDPAAFKDTYHDDLMKRIQEKIKKGQTQEITKPADDEGAAPASSNVIDLASLLKKSIDTGAGKPKAGAKGHLRLVQDSKVAPKRKKA